MKKQFYENGRVKFYQRQQLIELDGSTIAAIAITTVIIFFSGVILLMLNAIGLLPETLFQPMTAQQKKTTVHKTAGDTQPLELAFVEMPKKQTIQKPLIIEKKIEVIKEKPLQPPTVHEKKLPLEKIAVNQHKEPPTRPLPPIKKTVVKKVATPAIKEDKTPEAEKPKPSEKPSDEIFQVTSLPKKDESKGERKLRLYLTAQVNENINLYKKYINKKHKYIPGSYIIKIELNKKQKAKVTTESESNNKFFNLCVIRTFSTIEYPPVEEYVSGTYTHTFVIYYKPLTN